MRNLIRQMSLANRLWGAERIVCELKKIGIEVAKSTVEKYMARPRKPGTTSESWKTFLREHIKDIVSIDFFVMPTIRNQVLCVFLSQSWSDGGSFTSSSRPTRGPSGRDSKILEAFPSWDAPPEYSLRGSRSLVGTIRRECRDHLVVMNERRLKGLLRAYLGYCRGRVTHQSLKMDSSDGRPIQARGSGHVVEVPELGGLHHHYERVAA